MGILASQPGHCLAEILYLWREKELGVDIPFVISNCEAHREFVRQYKVPFYFVPATKRDRKEAELLNKLAGQTDFLVLARYMLILSKKFLNAYSKDIINIHHGFLPSFKGAHAYRQALSGGVKVIGATSHFVTEKLDEGPIIAQEVESVSHKDNLADLIRKGKNLEKQALVDAIRAYIDYRVIKYNHKTIVF
jgi:formyltetrahydrofolate deformylase